MGEKTIHVAEDTWRALQARSRPGESLDETIDRLLTVSDRAEDPEWDDEVIDQAVSEMQSELEDDIDES